MLDGDARHVAASLNLLVRGDLVNELDQPLGFRFPGLKFHASVKVFRILSHHDEIDRQVAEKAADALVLLTRTNAGVKAELLPKVDVDAAESLSHRRRNGRL